MTLADFTTTIMIWSYFCSFFGILSLIYYGKKKIAGPALGIVSEFFWAGFTIASASYGLWPIVLVYGGTHAYNLIKWGKTNVNIH